MQDLQGLISLGFQFTASYEADQEEADITLLKKDFQFTASYEADQVQQAISLVWTDLSIHSLIRGWPIDKSEI